MADFSDNVYTPAQRHLLLVAALLGLGGLVVLGLYGYLTAFLGAGLLYVLLRPWWVVLTSRRGWPAPLAAAALLLFVVLALVGPAYGLSALLLERLHHVGQLAGPVLVVVHRLEEITGFSVSSAPQVAALAREVTTHVSSWLPSLVGSLLNFVVVAGLLLVTLYFMLTQEAAFRRGLRRYLPFRPEVRRELAQALDDNVRAGVLGQGLVAVVQGLLTGLTLWLFQGPDPWLGGVLALLFAFVPALGTPLVWGPAALLKFSQGATGQGAGIMVVGSFMFVLEHLLRVWLGRRHGNIHPLITLAGVVLGLELFGILGLVLGPLLLSCFLVLLRVFARENRHYPAVARPAAARSAPALEPA